MRFSVTDDSGFLAIYDPDAYRSFVSADWDFGVLRRRFIEEMDERRLLIWGTGLECTWQIEISRDAVLTNAFRQITGHIQSSKGRLCLGNYESLSMAAQFEDVKLPERHQSELLFQVPPGDYCCRVLQLNDPESDRALDNSTQFVLELTPLKTSIENWKEIPWFEER
jgi:hypothetical protein